MNTTKEQKKAKALELMKQLDIFDPYIEGFRDEDKICFFENFGGFWAEQEPDLMKKVRELEAKRDCLVYAITHEYMEFGEIYDFLIITDYKEEWDTLVRQSGKQFFAFAFAFNKSIPEFSEFGTIGIQSAFGGIRRIS